MSAGGSVDVWGRIRDDVEVLLRVVYGGLKGLSWTRTIGEGEHRVAVGMPGSGLCA
jgi:hypothetical protein